MEIDIEKEKAKYIAEVNSFTSQLQQLDQQREAFIRALHERRGIIAFLNSLTVPVAAPVVPSADVPTDVKAVTPAATQGG